MQEAQTQPFINPDYQPGTENGSAYINPEFGGRSLIANVVPSIPGSVAMGVAGGPLAKGAELGFKAAGLAPKIAQYAGSGLGFGASEGVFSAAQNAEQWGQQQRELGVDEDIIAKGQDQIFKDTALKTGALSALTGGASYGLIRQGLGKPAAELGGKEFFKATGKGMLEEAMQEAPQSYFEQRTTNQATKDYVNPDQDVNEGALNAGIVGGIAGGVMGAAGGISHINLGPLSNALAQAQQLTQPGVTDAQRPTNATVLNEPEPSDRPINQPDTAQIINPLNTEEPNAAQTRSTSAQNRSAGTNRNVVNAGNATDGLTPASTGTGNQEIIDDVGRTPLSRAIANAALQPDEPITQPLTFKELTDETKTNANEETANAKEKGLLTFTPTHKDLADGEEFMQVGDNAYYNEQQYQDKLNGEDVTPFGFEPDQLEPIQNEKETTARKDNRTGIEAGANGSENGNARTISDNPITNNARIDTNNADLTTNLLAYTPSKHQYEIINDATKDNKTVPEAQP
ncbi:MAG: hypothetical protein WC856_27790, partial [Methylococcaceae bacterium]